MDRKEKYTNLMLAALAPFASRSNGVGIFGYYGGADRVRCDHVNRPDGLLQLLPSYPAAACEHAPDDFGCIDHARHT